MTADIAVTGATGGVGGRVAQQLANRGVSQRLIVRDPSRAPSLANSDVALSEYADGKAMRAALEGMHTLLFVSGSEASDRLDQHLTVVAAATAAGVERIVYTSFIGAAPDSVFTFGRDHFHTEEAIRESGMALAALRNNMYMDLLPHFASEGVIRGPAGEGRFAPVARDDIADVAVALLLDQHDRNGRWDVTGPELLTMDDVAQALTDVTGKPVRYEAETLDQAYASRASYGAPEWEVAGWVSSYSAIAAGEMDIVSNAVADIAGHAPVSFEHFLRRTA